MYRYNFICKYNFHLADSETEIIFLIDAFDSCWMTKAISRKAERKVWWKCSKGERIQKEKKKRQQNIELNWEKDRIRKQKSRLNKAGKAVATSPAHKAVSTLSKAIKKALSALPKSPRKRTT